MQHTMRRLKFWGAAMSGLASFQFLLTKNQDQASGPLGIEHTLNTCIYHEPPTGVDYSTNPSVFGKILEGEVSSRSFGETKEIYAFEDRSPKAELHGLVIPKRFVKSVFSLKEKDVELLQEMRQLGLDIVQEQQPEAFQNSDFIFCFHIPPFNSVDHLHMHVLAPATKMNFVYRYIKYNCPARWCISDLQVIERLKQGKPPVP
jgi:diadenosine tetraphosphate (Ap4A) HIT family hydrolase